MNLKSFLVKAGAALAPLTLMLALGGAQPVQAAAPTVVVAPIPNPTDCGKFKVQSTDLAATLAAARKGTILVCPGEYALPGDTVIDGANGLTITQAIKGQQPVIGLASASEVGLEIVDSSNVVLSGLRFDATLNHSPDLVMLYFNGSSGKVQNATLRGSDTTATGILVSNLGAARALAFSVSGSQVLGYQSFGLDAAGPVRVSVTSSQFDSTDAGRINTTIATGVKLDGSAEDAITPTGSISKSSFGSQAAGVWVVDGGSVTVSANTFTLSQIGVWFEQLGQNHPNLRNNRVIGNKLIDCSTCVLIEDEANDPLTFKLLNTQVTGNTFENPNVPIMAAIDFLPFGPAQKTVTGTVSGNVFNALTPGQAIFNNHDWAGIRIGKNKFVD